MFCFQCQETAKNQGCTVKGVCGKPEETANLQDLLIYVLKGISIYGEKAKELDIEDRKAGLFIAEALFATITNVAWDNDRIIGLIKEALKIREDLKSKFMAAYKEKTVRSFQNNCMTLRSGLQMMRRRLTRRQKGSAFLPPRMKMFVPSESC